MLNVLKASFDYKIKYTLLKHISREIVGCVRPSALQIVVEMFNLAGMFIRTIQIISDTEAWWWEAFGSKLLKKKMAAAATINFQ